MNFLTTYWLQRDLDSPAEGPYTREEILSMVKRRVITLSAVVNEPGQPTWMRVGDVFSRELRMWRWKKMLFKLALVAVLGVGILLVLREVVQKAVRDYNSPEAVRARYQADQERDARIEASLVPVEQWEAVANVFEQAGATVMRDGNRRRMRVTIPMALAQQLNDYQLKVLVQSAYSRLGNGCQVTLEDEFGTKLSRASAWGVSVEK